MLPGLYLANPILCIICEKKKANRERGEQKRNRYLVRDRYLICFADFSDW